MLTTPWKTRGICVSAPASNEIELFKEFVEKKLAPGKCNLMVMIIRYRYQWKSHPECMGKDPLSEEQVKEMVKVCRDNGIRLIPDMNLLGHQSGKTRDSIDGLLKGHPELDETPDMDEVFYCRSICPSHPDALPIVCDLMDEIIDAFEADAIHIGCDEVFDIGKCPRCKDTPTYKLFANWVNALADHAKEAKNCETFIWGDRFLNGLETGYGAWEASGNFTEPAIDLINKDIVICDWHYEDMTERYPANGRFLSVEAFAKAGLKMLVCPWRYQKNAEMFVNYALENDAGNIDGFMATTWCGFGDIARYMLKGELNEKNALTLENLAKTLDWFFAE